MVSKSVTDQFRGVVWEQEKVASAGKEHRMDLLLWFSAHFFQNGWKSLFRIRNKWSFLFQSCVCNGFAYQNVYPYLYIIRHQTD